MEKKTFDGGISVYENGNYLSKIHRSNNTFIVEYYNENKFVGTESFTSINMAEDHAEDFVLSQNPSFKENF